MDMYAGVEHLGRATVDFVDTMLIVVEPTRRSLTTANQIKQLAEDIGLTRLWLVGNRIRNEEDVAFLEKEAGKLPLLGYLPDDPGVVEADHKGASVYAQVPSLREAAGRIADQLDKLVQDS
jgi:CO dehydrogenase maturation factor